MKKSLNRRVFLGAAAGIVAGTAMTGLIQLINKRRKLGEKPNVVFIMADDLSSFDLQCYNPNLKFTTPFINKLAKEGALFREAYSATPICTPTRVALITGKYPQKFGEGLQRPLTFNDRFSLPKIDFSLPSLLQKIGYSTALVGKWHLGRIPASGPLSFGYQEFFGISAGLVDYFNHLHSTKNLDLYENNNQVHRKGYLTDLLTERAVEFLSRKHSKPFFLSLHYNAPHFPLEGPDDERISEELLESQDGDYLTRMRGTGSPETYAKMIQRMDEGIGSVLDTLSKKGLDENTLIIFTSDNGGIQYSAVREFLRASKGYVYEAGIRVPCIFRWPSVIEPESVFFDPIITMDLTASVLSIAEVPLPDLDGVSLWPLLLNGTKLEKRNLYWRFQDQAAVRSGEWKYVRNEEGRFLFNIDADPREKINFANVQPALIADLENEFKKWSSDVDKNQYL